MTAAGVAEIELRAALLRRPTAPKVEVPADSLRIAVDVLHAANARPAPPPGPEGEAVERVRVWLTAHKDIDYSGSPWVSRYVTAESDAPLNVADIAALLAAVDRLTADAGRQDD